VARLKLLRRAFYRQVQLRLADTNKCSVVTKHCRDSPPTTFLIDLKWLIADLDVSLWTPRMTWRILCPVTLSARNRLEGKVVEIQFGGVMAHVVMRVGKNLIESVITKRSAEEMKLKVGTRFQR
jgi:molybdopterin-binding protein